MSSNTPSDDAEEPVAWKSLTDEELRGIEKVFHAERVRTSDEEYLVIYPADYWDWQRAIEKALKEKNHPPKPAEPEAETIETLKAENFKLASGQCTEGGPWGDEGGTPYCKYAEPAARKPMMEEELDRLLDDPNFRPEVKPLFIAGIRFAEKHHNIRGSDE